MTNVCKILSEDEDIFHPIPLEQDFNPPLYINCEEGTVEIENRSWTTYIDYAELCSDNSQYMGYIKKDQIEEVWKKYNDRVYISNYGYVALFETKEEQEQAEKILGDIKWWGDVDKEALYLIYKHIAIPENKCVPGCKVWLYISGEKGGSIHRMVAEKFLIKPKGWRSDWVVHHIDNNSYNNSVTNLIWLPPESHKENHWIFHPMSYENRLTQKINKPR